MTDPFQRIPDPTRDHRHAERIDVKLNVEVGVDDRLYGLADRALKLAEGALQKQIDAITAQVNKGAADLNKTVADNPDPNPKD